MPPDDPRLWVLWEQITGEVLDLTRGFPRAIRFTITRRLEDTTIDILEHLVDARFASAAEKAPLLALADRRLNRLRVLVRLAHAREWLSHTAYAQLARRMDEAGRMLGGWRKQQPG